MGNPLDRKPIKFGTDGWRAVIADNFTFDNVELVTHAIGHYLLNRYGTEKPVVVGYDCRFLADRFASHAANVFQSLGFSVLLTQRYMPTPVVANAAKVYETAGSLMFTASHNPPEYMGIKFIPEYAGPATSDIIDPIVALVREYENQGIPPLTGKTGTLELFDPYDRYVELLSKTIDFDLLRQANLNILYDPMYGAGLGFLDRIYTEKTGHTLDLIHGHLDPSFGGQMPEPKEELLGELREKVPAGGYDLGIANDGDADRFGIVDEQGHFLGADHIVPLVFRYLYHQRGYRGSVVRTTATSMLIDALAEKLGVTVHETPVGFKHLGELMRREDVIIAGEESGGLSILGHIPEKDGILGDFLVAEIIAREGKPLSAIYKDLLDEAGVQLHGVSVNLHLDDEKKQALIAEMRRWQPGDLFAGQPICHVMTKDGIKFLFGQYDWVLLRPSGTEPVLRLYGESTNPDNARRYREAVEELIHAPLSSA